MNLTAEETQEVKNAMKLGLPILVCVLVVCALGGCGTQQDSPWIKNELTELNSRVYSTTGTVGKLQSDIADLKTSVDPLKQPTQVLTLPADDKRFAKLESWRDETDTAIEELSGRIGGGITDLQDIARGTDQRIIALEKQFAELKKNQCHCNHK